MPCGVPGFGHAIGHQRAGYCKLEMDHGKAAN
jgi:hypothetical protein